MRVGLFALGASLVSLAFCAVGHVAGAQESQIAPLQAAARAGWTPASSVALGRALRRAGHHAEALAELRRGISAAGSNPEVLARLDWEVARVHMDRHDFPQSLASCRVLGGVRGAAADGHACAADAHLVWQRATEALTEVAAALAVAPDCYEAKIAEGRAYDFELDESKSETAFRAAISLRPDGADGHLGLGRVLVKRSRTEDATKELRRAVELDPNGPEALYELAMALGHGAESVGLLERATHERSSFAEAWLALGVLQLSSGDIADAKKAADAALRNDAKTGAPHLLLGKVALADGRPDDAMKEGQAALKVMANSASARLLVADANAKKGEIDRALEAYQAAWGLDHGDPTALVHASVACHDAGRDTSARAFGVKATEEFPRWGPGWVALGDALVGQGEKSAARAAYGKALDGEGPVDRDAVRRKLGAL